MSDEKPDGAQGDGEIDYLGAEKSRYHPAQRGDLTLKHPGFEFPA